MVEGTLIYEVKVMTDGPFPALARFNDIVREVNMIFDDPYGNVRRLEDYLTLVAKRERLWHGGLPGGKKIEIPGPELAYNIEVNPELYHVRVTEGPNLVIDPIPAPWDVPKPPKPPAVSVVGDRLGSGWYAAGTGNTATEGTVVTHTTGEVLKMKKLSPFQPWGYWLTAEAAGRFGKEW